MKLNGSTGKTYLFALLLAIGLCACGTKEVAPSVLESLAEPIGAGEQLTEAEGDPEQNDVGVAEDLNRSTAGEHEQSATVNPRDREQADPGDNGAQRQSAIGKSGNDAAPQIIFEEGGTLETRIGVPAGYERETAVEESLSEYLHSFPLKPAGYAVHLYDGSEKPAQQDHIAVFDLPIEEYDLQQCADSVMRVYAEYFWATEQFDRIKFHFTNGFLCEYEKWRDGYRVSVNGNNVSWVKSKSVDTSYDCFVKYLKTVFCYAGTLSMEKESDPTTMTELKAGDVFLYGGSPGHVVMVVDTCVNEQGKKAFLLAQGYMPAQEFHLLKNNLHPEDPWYYEEEVVYPFHTPEYTFQEGSLRSLKY